MNSMTKNSMTSSKSRTVVLAASLLILPSVLAAHHLGDDNGSDPELVVFGDSLADGGNYFVQTGQHTMRPFEFVPSAPYAIGGFHFSNGRTWVEQLARRLHDRKSGKPSLRVPGRFTNYAYGRARSRPGAATFPDFDLGTQVGLFLTDFGGIAPSGSTYVIGTGSNDVRDALTQLIVDPSGLSSGAILQAAVTATADNIMALWGSGARTFLVPNSANIGITPAVRAAGPQAEFGGMQLSVGYNLGLSAALDALEALPGINIIRMDVFTILNELVADPESAGLMNVTDSCITPGVVIKALCNQPGQYLFWDGAHPTRAGHRHLAVEAEEILTDS